MICVLTGCNFPKENGDLQTEEDIENTQNHGESEKKIEEKGNPIIFND